MNYCYYKCSTCLSLYAIEKCTITLFNAVGRSCNTGNGLFNKKIKINKKCYDWGIEDLCGSLSLNYVSFSVSLMQSAFMKKMEPTLIFISITTSKSSNASTRRNYVTAYPACGLL